MATFCPLFKKKWPRTNVEISRVSRLVATFPLFFAKTFKIKNLVLRKNNFLKSFMQKKWASGHKAILGESRHYIQKGGHSMARC